MVPCHPTRIKYQSMVTILIMKSSFLTYVNATTENIFPPKKPSLMACESRDVLNAQFLLHIY